jgi:hypothetical protein
MVIEVSLHLTCSRRRLEDLRICYMTVNVWCYHVRTTHHATLSFRANAADLLFNKTAPKQVMKESSSAYGRFAQDE